jgi:hypothetical protein
MPEKFESQPEVERKLVSIEESRRIAIDLLTRFKTELQQHYQAVSYMTEDVEKEEGIWNSTSGTDAISGFLERIPEEVKKDFWGHGITKGNNEFKLTAFLNLLANKSVKGEEGPLKGYMSAYSNASFFIISRYRQHLSMREGDAKVKSNEIGWVADVGAFVVNYDHYPIIDELRKMFPGERIIKASELPEYIASEAEKSE